MMIETNNIPLTEEGWSVAIELQRNPLDLRLDKLWHYFDLG